jgi:hypothetical protein
MKKSTTPTAQTSKTRTVDGSDHKKPPEDPASEQQQASRMMNMDESEGLYGSNSEGAVGSHPQAAAPFASLLSSISQQEKPTGSHAFDNLDNVDLPQYVKAHITTLTFPEKVRSIKTTLSVFLKVYNPLQLTTCRSLFASAATRYLSRHFAQTR